MTLPALSPTWFTVTVIIMSVIQLALVVWLGRTIRLNRDLRDLIFSSTPVCLICYRPETGHAVLEDYGELDPVHEYVPAYLVYVPVFEPANSLLGDLR